MYDNASILIVEDESIIGLEIRSSLELLGYRVTAVVNSGEAAIEKVASDIPELILMDIRLNGELDGIDTADIIKDQFNIPVVFLTAHFDQEKIDRAKLTRPFGYLIKPVRQQELKTAIEMALYLKSVDDKKRQAEIELKASEYKLSTHIKLTPMGVIDFDRDLNITAWNPGAEKIFGYTQEEAVGRNSFEILVPDHEAEKIKNIPLWQTRKPSESINDNKTKDGRIITCQWFNTPILDMEGIVVGLTAVCQDITRQIQTENVLKQRVMALTQPMTETRHITFDGLFNLEDIQFLQDQFAKATGVASIITHPDGTPITNPSNFCRLCNDIIRKTDKGLTNCFTSDATIGRPTPDGPIIQPCMSGGLWDAGATISVGGKHIANWLIGQVRDDKQSEARIRQYAREIGAQEEEAVKAFLEVPAMSLDHFKLVANALYTLANQLSTIAYQNIQQARFIVEQKKAEVDLRESEEKYRELAENINSIILKQDPEFRITFMNRFGMEFFGYTEDELIGKSIIGTIVPEYESTGRNLRSVMTELFSNPESFDDNENENIRKNGERVWVAWRNKAILRPDGSLKEILSTGYDITRQKTAEEALQKAHDDLEKKVQERTVELEKAKDEAEKAYRFKSDFLANISHELRTPMHHILSYASIGKDRMKTLQEIKGEEYFSHIFKSGDELLTLINDLLELSKMEANRVEYHMRKTSLRKIIDTVVAENRHFFTDKNIDFRIEETEPVDSLICDPFKITQVVRNLLTNAMKFSKEGGHILVKIEAERWRESRQANSAFVKISIVDDGIGIPAFELDTIFEKYIQSSKTRKEHGGTGLGLAISRQIILGHNGQIWAENNPGGGTIFSFLLPWTPKIKREDRIEKDAG